MNKDKILSYIKSEPVLTEVPEWGCNVYLGSLTIGEWLQVAEEDAKNRLFIVLEKAILNEEGKQIFKVDDLKGMNDKQTKVLTRLFYLVHNARGDVEELEKK